MDLGMSKNCLKENIMPTFEAGDILKSLEPVYADRLFLVVGFVNGTMTCYEFSIEQADDNFGKLYYHYDNLITNVDVGAAHFAAFEKVSSLREMRGIKDG